MFTSKLRFLALSAVLLAGTNAFAADAEWISLFDGKTLDGWEKVGKEDSVWEVKDGAISGSGPASMLVNTKGSYKNFRYRAEIMINDKANSGLYFRTTERPGFSDGYEAQIDSTHTDPIRTGSIYGMCHVYQEHVKPDTWFTYDIEVRDDVLVSRRSEINIESASPSSLRRSLGPVNFAIEPATNYVPADDSNNTPTLENESSGDLVAVFADGSEPISKIQFKWQLQGKPIA